MSWGNSGWGSSGHGSSGGAGGSSGWGKSGWGNNHSESNKDPEGTHNQSCIAGGSGWGNGGLMGSYYDERCSGCRRDRAMSSWGSSSKKNGVVKLIGAAAIGGALIARKSLWD